MLVAVLEVSVAVWALAVPNARPAASRTNRKLFNVVIRALDDCALHKLQLALKMVLGYQDGTAKLASTEDLTGETPVSLLTHFVDLGEHFFTRTRWERTLKPVHGFPDAQLPATPLPINAGFAQSLINVSAPIGYFSAECGMTTAAESCGRERGGAYLFQIGNSLAVSISSKDVKQ